jgi:uncharacterized protein
MEQRLSFITLGVSDPEGMKHFYRDKFGWETLKDGDGIVFFRLNGIILGLYPRTDLAADAGVPHPGRGFKGFTLAICLRTVKEVDETFELLSSKGVHVVKEPQKVFWGGYSGYISDPEDNLWEIAYNPFLELDEHGNVKGHA